MHTGLASWAPRNIVVPPGGAFRISGLIVLVVVVLCPLFGVVEPGVGELIRQTAFSLFEVVEEGNVAKLGGAAPTSGGYGAGSATRVTFSPHSHSRARWALCHS